MIHHNPRRFLFMGVIAILGAVIGQIIVTSGHFLPAIVVYLVSISLLIIGFRKQPGPSVGEFSWRLTIPKFQPVWQVKPSIRVGTTNHKKPPEVGLDPGFLDFGFIQNLAMVSSRYATSVIQSHFFWGLAALPVGILGQYYLLSGQMVGAGLAFGSGVLLLIFAFRKQSKPEGYQPDAGIVHFIKKPAPGTGYIPLGGSVVCAFLAFCLFDTSVPAIIPWLLYLSSMALLILAVYWLDGINLINETSDIPWSRVERIIFLAIFAIAAFVRLYQLDKIPFGIFYDEADNGLHALEILNTPDLLPVYIPSTNLPAHFIYLIALSFRILGNSTVALRLVSVAFGLGTILAAYFAGQELFNRRIGLVLAFFLAVSRWDINWSRIGMHGVSVPFFELLSVALLLRLLRRQRWWDYALTGLVVGLGICFYVPLRFFPMVLILFVVILWISRRGFLRATWQGWLVLGLAGIIAAVPIFSFAVNHPDDFFARTQTTSIFTGKTTQEAWNAVARTTQEHLLMFNYHGDPNGRHNVDGEPMLDPISGSLLVLGIGLSFWRIRQPGSFLLLAWFFLMLVPGILSLDFESPQSLRAIGSLPAAYLLAVVPLHALWQEWDKAASQKIRWVFQIGLAVLLAATGIINYQLYFFRQSVAFSSWMAFSTPETITGRIMAQMGSQVDYYVSTFYYQAPTIQFLAPEISSYHVLQTSETLPLRLNRARETVIILDADREPFFQQAKQYYPNATFEDIKAPSGQTALYEIILQPEDISSIQGLTASYYRDAEWDSEPELVKDEKNFSFDWKDGDPLPFPFGVEWKGALFAPTYGTYRLAVHSLGDVELSIDDAPVALAGPGGEQTAEVLLAKGNHTFQLRAVVKGGHFELDWSPPSEMMTVIPASAFFLPRIGSHGLQGSYYPNGSWQSPPAYTQVDPWIHFYFHQPPLKRPYTVEWVGKIAIAKSGTYAFGLESIDESSLAIDDNLVVDDHTPNYYLENQVDLTRGVHNIRIRFADRTSSTHINVYWTPPGSTLENLPQEVLYPPWAGEEALAKAEEPAAPSQQTPAAGENPGSQPGLAGVQAEILWQTGHCGSGNGQFLSPNGLALDRQGNLWVADTGNSRLVKIDPKGNILGSFGNPAGTENLMRQPFDLGIGPGGDLFVLDSGSQKVLQRFDPAGALQGTLGTNLSMYTPRGLAIDSAGGLYVADTGGGRVLHLTAAGEVLEQWKLVLDDSKPGQPVGAVVGPDGAVYTVEMVARRIWKLLPGGNHQSWPAEISGDTVTGSRIGLGPDHNLYLSDPERSRLVFYSLDGYELGQVGGNGQFATPVGITVGADGVIYVSDNARCNVSALRLAGK